MEIDLSVRNEVKDFQEEYEETYRQIVKEACRQLQIEDDLEISCVFVSDQKIQEMNAKYRGIDRSTDVISFALEDSAQFYVEGQPRCLGDIFISVEHAKMQAKMYQHSVYRELCFLFTHGLLHLLGFDHMEEKEEEEMIAMQKSILNNLQIER